ncbi:MAG: hypothetical protein IPK03_16860 [Bacteroidetes bacterium]|nr:hypothetical protein [Bacteroidota bacterium]
MKHDNTRYSSQAFPAESSKKILATGDWRLATGDWRLAIGDWRLAIGDWRLAIGDWRLAIGEFNVFLALWRHQFILNAIKKTFQLKSVDYFEYEGTHHSPARVLTYCHLFFKFQNLY